MKWVLMDWQNEYKGLPQIKPIRCFAVFLLATDEHKLTQTNLSFKRKIPALISVHLLLISSFIWGKKNSLAWERDGFFCRS